MIVIAAWVAVAGALAGVWNTSVQLGLSTWWLGPRGDPQPVAVNVLPLLPAVLMILAAINGVRRLPWWGLAAAVTIAAVGVGDLDRVPSLALVELVIAACAAAVSVASLTGTYRPATAPQHDPPEHDPPA